MFAKEKCEKIMLDLMLVKQKFRPWRVNIIGGKVNIIYMMVWLLTVNKAHQSLQ